MLLEQQEEISVKHLIQHFNRAIPTIVDHSCLNCFPRLQVIPVTFLNFWNWIETYYFGKNFTLYTVSALPIYYETFRRDPNTTKSSFVISLALKLLLSISYYRRPSLLQDLLYYLLNFTFCTNYFENPITPEVITTFKTASISVKDSTFTAKHPATPAIVLFK